jgi:hypothetical protein
MSEIVESRAEPEQSTGAHAVIATNPTAGLVTFIDLLSPPKAAVQYWKVDPVDAAELPELRSMSDIAWGFWNRVAGPDKLGSIKYFIFTAVSKPELKNVIIPRALKIMNAEDGKHQAWPGTEFRVGSAAASKEEKEAAEALVGKLPSVRASLASLTIQGLPTAWRRRTSSSSTRSSWALNTSPRYVSSAGVIRAGPQNWRTMSNRTRRHILRKKRSQNHREGMMVRTWNRGSWREARTDSVSCVNTYSARGYKSSVRKGCMAVASERRSAWRGDMERGGGDAVSNLPSSEGHARSQRQWLNGISLGDGTRRSGHIKKSRCSDKS